MFQCYYDIKGIEIWYIYVRAKQEKCWSHSTLISINVDQNQAWFRSMLITVRARQQKCLSNSTLILINVDQNKSSDIFKVACGRGWKFLCKSLYTFMWCTLTWIHRTQIKRIYITNLKINKSRTNISKLGKWQECLSGHY